MSTLEESHGDVLKRFISSLSNYLPDLHTEPKTEEAKLIAQIQELCNIRWDAIERIIGEHWQRRRDAGEDINVDGFHIAEFRKIFNFAHSVMIIMCNEDNFFRDRILDEIYVISKLHDANKTEKGIRYFEEYMEARNETIQKIQMGELEWLRKKGQQE